MKARRRTGKETFLKRIAILKEILRRLKREREIQFRDELKYLSKIQKEKKEYYRQQLQELYDKFDEEDRKASLENNNQEEIEKLINNHYRK